MPLTKHELLDELTNMLIRIDKLMQEYTAQGHHERVVSLFHAKNHITEVRLKEEMEEEKDEPSH